MKVIPLGAPARRSPSERRERALRVRGWISQPELPARVEDWPEEAMDRYEERAGIVEHLGGLARDEAERRAEAIVRERWARLPCPSTDDHLTNANTDAFELSHPSWPRFGPLREAVTPTGQPGGGVGHPQAVGGQEQPDSSDYAQETTPCE